MVRECRPRERELSSLTLGRRSTMRTSVPASVSSAASIIPVGPPPAITTACSDMHHSSFPNVCEETLHHAQGLAASPWGGTILRWRELSSHHRVARAPDVVGRELGVVGERDGALGEEWLVDGLEAAYCVGPAVSILSRLVFEFEEVHKARRVIGLLPPEHEGEMARLREELRDQQRRLAAHLVGRLDLQTGSAQVSPEGVTAPSLPYPVITATTLWPAPSSPPSIKANTP